MQSEICIDKKRKLLLVCLLLFISAVALFVLYLLDAGRIYLIWCVENIVLFIETAFLWKIDEKHIGIFFFIVIKIVGVATEIYDSFIFLYAGLLFVIFHILIDLLVLATWGMNAYSFYTGFQKKLFKRLSPRSILSFSLLSTLFSNIVLVLSDARGWWEYANYGKVYAMVFPLPIVLSFSAQYLLFRDFTFEPMNVRSKSVKEELEQLQEAYDQGYLSEEVYQKRRQDIINRI